MTHYVVERRETSRVVWSTVSDMQEKTHVTVVKLVGGNEYVFRVMAVNKFGVGEPLESEPVIAKNSFGMFWDKFLNVNNKLCFISTTLDVLVVCDSFIF